MTPNRPFRAFLLPALASVLAACNQGDGPEASSVTDAKKREPAKVLVEPIERRDTARYLETTTRVESEHEVELYPRAAGVLIEVLVEEGDPVEAGQVLARIDDRELRNARADAEAALAEARAGLPRLDLAISEFDSVLATARQSADQAERDHLRNVGLSTGETGRTQLLSAKDLDASRLLMEQKKGDVETARLAKEKAILEAEAGRDAVDRALLALERAELQLSFTEITAPIAGVIAERRVRLGDTVAPGTGSFVLTDPDSLIAVFYRPQRELRLFRGAKTARSTDGTPGPSNGDGDGEHGDLLAIVARADGLPGCAFEGWIERVSPTVDPESGNFRVTARLETGEAPDRLLAGMLVRLEIVTERHADSLVVPKRAIRREGDRSVIFVVADGIAHQVEIEEGFTDGDDVEVTALGETPLEEGALVVTVGNRDLEEGTEVSVPEPEEDLEAGELDPNRDPNEDPAEEPDLGAADDAEPAPAE